MCVCVAPAHLAGGAPLPSALRSVFGRRGPVGGGGVRRVVRRRERRNTVHRGWVHFSGHASLPCNEERNATSAIAESLLWKRETRDFNPGVFQHFNVKRKTTVTIAEVHEKFV